MKLPWSRPRDRARPDPDPAERKATGGGWFALHALGDADWSDASFSALAREGFMRNPVVYRAVRMISETAAAVPWLLFENREERESHPLLDLVARPNGAESGPSFFEALYGNLLIGGDAYIHLVRGGNGLAAFHLLRPDRITVLTDEAGWPDGYRYQVGAKTVDLPAGDPLSDSGVYHIRQFHPLSDLTGFPPLQAALMALDTHNATGRWNKALLDNSARPSGALVYAPKDGGTLTPDQFDRLKTEWEEGYAGTERAGRPMLLEGGLDWRAMSLSPKEMDFIEAKHNAAREIALAFGVPPMLLGIPGDNTYANYQEANRSFYRMTILPLVGRVIREFSNRIAPQFGTGLRFEPDLDAISGLALERDLLWSRISAADFLTPDEKREAVGYGRKMKG